MSTSADNLSFRCRPSILVLALTAVFFTLGTVVLVWKASNNELGLSFAGLFTLEKAGASAFYWALVVLSALLALLSVWTIFIVLKFGIPDVVLMPDAIVFPVGFPTKRPQSVPYAQIQKLSRSNVNGQRFLTLHTAARKHHIPLNWLGSKEAGERLTNELSRRLS